jgi:hypothetical protein
VALAVRMPRLLAPRPRSVAETLQQRIVDLVRSGTYPEVTAHTVGIRKNTWSMWLERGVQKPNSREGRFLRAMAEAAGLLETVLVQTIVAAARKDPEIALKFLERRHPERWLHSRAGPN